MPIQFISDNQGNPTAVLIPISEWQLLTTRYKELKLLEHPPLTQQHKPSDYAGTIPAKIAEAMHRYLEEATNEWD